MRRFLIPFAGVCLASCSGSKPGARTESVTTESERVVIGWDPGLKTPRGVGISLDETMAPWSMCPQEPNGVCDNVPNGGGFYSLSVGSDYESPVDGKMDSRACAASPFSLPLSQHPVLAPFGRKEHIFQNINCPYSFEWSNDDGIVANMKVDSTGFGIDNTPNIYIGLQRNLPLGDAQRGGVNYNDPAAAPLMNDVDEVEFRYRASLCDKNVGNLFFGRGLYILSGYNKSVDKGFELSINLFEYLRGVERSQVSGILVQGVKSQDQLAAGNEHFQNTWHINGSEFRNFVELPGPYNLTADPACPGKPEGGWYHVKIKVKKLLKNLMETQPRFPKDPNFWAGMRWTGGTLGGLEFLGRGAITMQVRDIFHFKKPGASSLTDGTTTAVNAPPVNPPAQPPASPPSNPGQGASTDLDAHLEKLKVNARCNFDGEHYLNANPDVRNGGFNTAAKALEHYNNWGIKEKRSGGCPPSRDELARILGGQSVTSVQPPAQIVAPVQPQIVVPVQPQAQNNAPSSPAIPSGHFRIRSNLGQIWYGNNGQMCLYKNKRHAGVARVEDVSTIVDVPVDPNSFQKCPGWDSI